MVSEILPMNQSLYRPLLAPEDTELVELAKSGDKEAFGELLERTMPYSVKLAYSILHDREEAEDQVQAASFKAWQHVGNFHEQARFSTWFTRIVVNQCLMRLRKQKRQPVVALEQRISDDEKPFMREPVDTRNTPEDALGKEQLLAILRAEINHIPPLLRTALTMRDIEGKGLPEVAQQLGISVPAVKSRLLRARGELRERLKKHCGIRGLATLISDPAPHTV